ncbi:MAG: histidine phosphatase family protein [Hyphomicrobiaceae bacterium]|nr:histidine phosphatase family protein [Hyphomicrobiaceae bacterium]
MLTLSLLRHAKSSWSDARLRDFERPLNERGESAAPRMAAFMARRGLLPDLVLCSPAVRARQTLRLMLPYFEKAPRVAYDDALYLASPGMLLKLIRTAAAPVRHTMVVGHDPGLHMLAVELAGSGCGNDLEALAQKLPTAGLAVIAFHAGAWAEVHRGDGRLKLLMTPKRLP